MLKSPSSLQARGAFLFRVFLVWLGLRGEETPFSLRVKGCFLPPQTPPAFPKTRSSGGWGSARAPSPSPCQPSPGRTWCGFFPLGPAPLCWETVQQFFADSGTPSPDNPRNPPANANAPQSVRLFSTNTRNCGTLRCTGKSGQKTVLFPLLSFNFGHRLRWLLFVILRYWAT